MSGRKIFEKYRLTQQETVECLGLLREARALILRDAEAFHEAARTLEHIAQIHGKKLGNGLNAYKGTLSDLADASPEKVNFEKLFDTVNEARNSAVHAGVWARHLNTRLIDLFLILEQSLMNHLVTAQDIMVRNPVAIESWQLAGHARKVMLSNSFSHLHIYWEGKWKFVSESRLMKFLHSDDNHEAYKLRLMMSLEKVVKGQFLDLEDAMFCSPNVNIAKVIQDIGANPVLVVVQDHQERLLGIITPFDLL